MRLNVSSACYAELARVLREKVRPDTLDAWFEDDGTINMGDAEIAAVTPGEHAASEAAKPSPFMDYLPVETD